MKTLHTPNREEQALAEVGHTAISTRLAWLLSTVFLLTVCSVSVIQTGMEVRSARQDADVSSSQRLFGPLRDFAARLPQISAIGKQTGFFAANHALLEAMNDFEDELEKGSFLRQRLLPPVQRFMTSRLGVGNEQAYVGRDGWLFYRPDVDYVTGRGFLEPEVLRSRARSGDQWDPPPQPDPIAALIDFDRQLAERGIRLLVLPTPVKPMIQPGQLSPRDADGMPLNNPSYLRFVAELESSGIAGVDIGPLLATATAKPGLPQYLRADTHWTPEAVELTARELARRVQELTGFETPPDTGYLRRKVVVENIGDIATMLHLPAGQQLFTNEQVTTQRILTFEGRPWRADPNAQVLLLGDSFANIYSVDRLGWGAGAGLAEQLSYYLQKPVDKLALDAGGAHASRQALARELASGKDRLAGKKVVIYQFAMRELAFGDWKLIPLPTTRE
jgi:alginate O-acetyltransferase complex protein AlgJ